MMVSRYLLLSLLLSLLAGINALRIDALSRRTAVGLGVAAATLPNAPLEFASSAAEAATAPSALCDPCVTLVKSSSGALFTLVGTAHISEDSANLVRQVVREVKPDAVMLELDPARAGKLMERSNGAVLSTSEPAPNSSPSSSRAPMFGVGQLAGRLLKGDMQEAGSQAIGVGLSSLYKQMDSLGFQSGGEFVAAVEEADRIGATIVLGDRDARETIGRLRDAIGELLRNPPQPTGAEPPAALIAAAGGPQAEMTKDSINTMMSTLKQRQTLRELTAYLKSEVPPLYQALIAERDEFMAQSLMKAEARGGAQNIVAVVGLAHVDGIEAAVLRAQGANRPKPRTCLAA